MALVLNDGPNSWAIWRRDEVPLPWRARGGAAGIGGPLGGGVAAGKVAPTLRGTALQGAIAP